MAANSEPEQPIRGRRIHDRRMANHYLEKVHGYVNAYRQGGVDRVRLLDSFDDDWAQIQRYQQWAVAECLNDEVALQLCHLYAEHGAALLPLLNTEQAVAWLEPAIEAARTLKLEHAELLHQRNLGQVYDRAGRHAEALGPYQAALAMAESQQEEHLRADLLHRIGKVYRNLGKRHAHESERLYRDALQAMQAVGDVCGEARVRIDLGNVRANQGFYIEALEHFAPARELLALPACGDTRDESMLLGYLGNAYRNLGQYARADEAYRAAAEMAAALRERKMGAEHRFNHALLWRDVGRFDAMYECLDLANNEAKAHRSQRDTAKVQNGFASYYALVGEFDKALSCHGDATALLEEAGAQFLAEYARADRGRTLLLAGRPAEALEDLQPVVQKEARAHPLHRQQRATLAAQAYLALGDVAAARNLLADVSQLDDDPNTVTSRHLAAALYGVALARARDADAESVLRRALDYADERIAAEPWELAALTSRGLAAATLAVLAQGAARKQLRDVAQSAFAELLRRCGARGVRAEAAVRLALVGPLDRERVLTPLYDLLALSYRS